MCCVKSSNEIYLANFMMNISKQHTMLDMSNVGEMWKCGYHNFKGGLISNTFARMVNKQKTLKPNNYSLDLIIRRGVHRQ